MKYFFALMFLLVAGCSTSTAPGPFAPGGEYYVAPGKFVGVWALGTVVDSCTCFLTEADTNLRASVANRTTNEVLTLRGKYDNLFIDSWGERPDLHTFAVYDSSNFYGDTDVAPLSFAELTCWFSSSADTLTYLTIRGTDTLTIFCTPLKTGLKLKDNSE